MVLKAAQMQLQRLTVKSRATEDDHTMKKCAKRNYMIRIQICSISISPPDTKKTRSVRIYPDSHESMVLVHSNGSRDAAFALTPNA